jgi:hypothetical protein
MITEEYLKQRIKDLEDNICDSSLPLQFRKNQAFALLGYREDLKEHGSSDKARSGNQAHKI